MSDMMPVVLQMVAVSLPILLGWGLHKLGVLDDALDTGLSRLVMNVGLPCSILASIGSVAEQPATMVLLLIVASSFAAYFVAIAGAVLLTAALRVPNDVAGSYRFAIAFGNCGFIGLPVISAICGEEALLYAAIALIPANIMLFSGGALMFPARDGAQGSRWRSVAASLKSPTLAASVIVLALALAGVTNLGVVGESLGIVGQMTTPLALLVTGSSIARYDPRSMLDNWRAYVAAAGRLVIVPLASLVVVRLFPLDPYVARIVVLDCAMPVATVGALFCLQSGVDAKPMMQITFLSVVASVISIPFMSWVIG